MIGQPHHHVEYQVRSGYMTIVTGDGKPLPAFGASPLLGERFPSITLVHDWWGLTAAIRTLAVQLAQAGFYVIAPDLYDGQLAKTASEAAELVQQIARNRRFQWVMESLEALEHHQHATRRGAVVGVGLGGGFAFRAAIQRRHTEGAVAFSGFPQTYIGKFADCPTPVLAVYGSADPLIPAAMIDRLRRELTASRLSEDHRVTVIDGAGHDLFAEDPGEAQREHSAQALAHAVSFLNHHLRK